MSRVKSQLSESNILVIDDNEDVLSILKLVLRTLGCKKVYCASDAAEGFEIFCQNRVDLILLDYMMPTLDGVEFVQIVRSADDSPNKKVPIIMISAYCEMENVQNAKNSGVDDFLCKPVSMSLLRERITNVISKKIDGDDENHHDQTVQEEVDLDEIAQKSA